MSARASIAVGRNQKAKPSSRRGRRSGIPEQEVKDVEELATPRTPVTHLPDAPWEPLVTSFGYCIGFIMAVLSRQQLFTESTITAVLPVAAEFTWGNVGRMMRLWGIVLVANLAGTLFAALFCSFTPALPTQVHDELLAFGWWDMVFRAIASGFLMAAMVWLLPGAERTQLHVIALVTWLIAVGGFTHIVAGSMEAYLLVLAGDWAWWQMLSQFLLPVLIGNIIGGTALFALLSYAQVMEEIEDQLT